MKALNRHMICSNSIRDLGLSFQRQFHLDPLWVMHSLVEKVLCKKIIKIIYLHWTGQCSANKGSWHPQTLNSWKGATYIISFLELQAINRFAFSQLSKYQSLLQFLKCKKIIFTFSGLYKDVMSGGSNWKNPITMFYKFFFVRTSILKIAIHIEV